MPGFLTVNTIAELICFFISIFCLFNDKNPYWRVFIIYLLIVCGTEIGGILLRKTLHINYQIYMVFLIVECFMMSVFFYHLFSKYKKRMALLLFSWLAIFMILDTLEMAEGQFRSYPFMTSALISIVFVIASCYFYLIMIRDDSFKDLRFYPPFWMVNGILFYYFGGTAVNIFFDYLVHEKLTVLGMSVRYITFNILNVFLYSCWSYAFICRYLQRNSYSLSH